MITEKRVRIVCAFVWFCILSVSGYVSGPISSLLGAVLMFTGVVIAWPIIVAIFDPYSLDVPVLPAEKVEWHYSETVRTKRQVQNSKYVYILEGPQGSYKIGHTNDPDARLHKFEVNLPFPVKFIHVIKCENGRALESYLHRLYAKKRINGEWFELTPEDIEGIKINGNRGL